MPGVEPAAAAEAALRQRRGHAAGTGDRIRLSLLVLRGGVDDLGAGVRRRLLVTDRATAGCEQQVRAVGRPTDAADARVHGGDARLLTISHRPHPELAGTGGGCTASPATSTTRRSIGPAKAGPHRGNGAGPH